MLAVSDGSVWLKVALRIDALWRLASIAIGHESLVLLDLRGIRLGVKDWKKAQEKTKYTRLQFKLDRPLKKRRQEAPNMQIIAADDEADASPSPLVTGRRRSSECVWHRLQWWEVAQSFVSVESSWPVRITLTSRNSPRCPLFRQTSACAEITDSPSRATPSACH